MKDNREPKLTCPPASPLLYAGWLAFMCFAVRFCIRIRITLLGLCMVEVREECSERHFPMKAKVKISFPYAKGHIRQLLISPNPNNPRK